MTDRELDALIAERVMGCKVYRFDLSGEPRCDCPGANSAAPRPHGASDFFGALRRYSTDISAAWEVVEKMAAGEGFGGLVWFPPRARRYGFKEWGCASREGGLYSFADTAPRAICLAALKALGIEVPE